MPIIAFSGISGCGKSTISKILASELNAIVCNEPEENEWPAIITQQDKYDQASAILAFRQLWAKQFTDAYIASNLGKLAILDSYFFKIYGYYLGKIGMEWLLRPENKYLDLLITLNELDRNYFPDATHVVLFDTHLQDWQQFLHSRGRNWDTTPGFCQNFQLTKRYIEEATIEHCMRKNIPLIKFEHSFGNPKKQALLLKKILLQNKFIT